MNDVTHLSSRELAELIVDALIDAGCVSTADSDRAVEVTEEEIEARKTVGDY